MTLKLPTFKSPFAKGKKTPAKSSTDKRANSADAHGFSATLIAESVASESSAVAQSTVMNPPTISAPTLSASTISAPSALLSSAKGFSISGDGKLPLIGHLPATEQKRILQVGVFTFLLLSFGVLWLNSYTQGQAAKNTDLISAAMIDSQRMAKEASAVGFGNAKASGVFGRSKDAIAASVAALSGENGSSGVSSEVVPALNQVKSTWVKITEESELLTQSEKTLSMAGSSIVEFDGISAKTRVSLEKLADVRQRAGAKPAELAAIRQMATQLQSIQSLLLSFGEVDGFNTATIKNLDNQRSEFNKLWQAFSSGTEPFGGKIDPNTEGFAALMTEGNKLGKLGDTISENINALDRSTTSVKSIQDYSDDLMRELQTLKQAHLATSVGGYSNTVLAGIFALLALIGGWGMSKVNVDDSRRLAKRAEQQRAEAERLEQEAKRQNEQNQAAILRLMNELQEVADGDLTVQVTVSEDITGAIADSVNYTVEELRSLVSRINSTAGRVGDASGRAQQISSSLLTASEQQSREIRDTGESVLRLADSINKVSSSALESAKVARQSLEAAEQGADAVHRTIAGMTDIREQIQDTSKRIKRLGESSQEIGEIVELISDITEQTNVLALNAAIQAASAGEAGRGFTVVAEEVQRLAERSGEATKQISALIQTIQADTKDAVAAMERSTQNVVEGAKLSDAAGQALGEIGTVSRQLAELIESISVTTNREAASAGTVAQSIQRILLVTEQTSDGTQLTAGSIGQLSELAQDLRNSVTRFKVA